MTAPVYGVEPFDVGYGASFLGDGDPTLCRECPIVEDDGVLRGYQPQRSATPQQLAFVDGVMRTEARLTRADADGRVVTGLAGSWAVGAVLAAAERPLCIDRVRHGRAAVLCGGTPVSLPEQRGGWAWEAVAVEEEDLEAARGRLRRLMRDAEGEIAEQLAGEGWRTIVDGPLNNVRRTRTVPIVGYVKTHHRRMLDSRNWARVPELQPGERSSLFAIGDDLYGCYLRVGIPGPWASPWAGIARLEVPSGAGRAEATHALDEAASLLPGYGSAPHRDPRAPVNLAPVAGLEHALTRRFGDAALALRAVRAAVLELNGARS